MFEPIYRQDFSNIMPEIIAHSGQTLAIIIWHDFCQNGVNFVTPVDFSQQVAYIKHPAGKQIQPHIHNPILRQLKNSQEVLFIKKGKLRVDFYSQKQQYIDSRVLGAGDAIVLVSGGHGFTILEEIQMIEVKQGPYTGDHERTRFCKSSPELNLIND